MSREVPLKGNVYDLTVDYNAIDKPGLLSIYKYLMVKNSIKYCLDLLNKCLLGCCVSANLYLALPILLPCKSYIFE